MEQKLFDSEIKVMELVWEHEPISAKELSLLASERIGWNKNTTYTVIKKLVSKGYVCREDPDFICRALISREDVRRAEMNSLTKRLFGGSKTALFSSLLADEDLSEEELSALRRMIEKR